MGSILDAQDVSRILRVSVSHAYKLIREINRELEEEGYLTVRGKCPAKRLLERYALYEPNKKEEAQP